ncbi:MAG TPA: hypothetical protein VFF42_10360, partial [Candidatus Eremiobacteraceae bacterium]|nr:hypothetical protein [Candidatus Eremiobacteraceae bacterium]
KRITAFSITSLRDFNAGISLIVDIQIFYPVLTNSYAKFYFLPCFSNSCPCGRREGPESTPSPTLKE